MDTILVALTATATVLGLLWVVQRILPQAMNPKPERRSTSQPEPLVDSPAKRVVWAAIALGSLPLWLNSLDNMLVAVKWTIPFCFNLLCVVILPIFFVAYLMRALNGTPLQYPTSDIPITNGKSSLPMDAATESEILHALERGEKIEAIKLYRHASGVGLKEAKDFVEDMEHRNPASKQIAEPERRLGAETEIERRWPPPG